MESLYHEFSLALAAKDKKACVQLALGALEKKEVELVTLYEKVLGPALSGIALPGETQTLAIWEEHIATGIIETILSCCYPYLLQRPERKNPPKVLVFCPSEEYHEIGAKMVSDFFTLCGYAVYYIGANTPEVEYVLAASSLSPRYIAISVTNAYNLRALKRGIAQTRAQSKIPLEIIIGGNALTKNPNLAVEIGADRVLSSFADIEHLAKGDGLL